MATVLHMDTEAVRAVGQQLAQQAETIRQQAQGLAASVHGMNWQGPGREMLVGEFDQIQQALLQFADQGTALNRRLEREVEEWEAVAMGSGGPASSGQDVITMEEVTGVHVDDLGGDNQPPLPEGLEKTVRDITTLIKIFFSDVLKDNPALKDSLKGLGLGVGILADEDFNRNLERAVAGELGKVWVKGMAAPLFLYSDSRQLVGRVLETAVRSTGNTQAADHIHTVFASYDFSAAAEQFSEQFFDMVKRALEGPPKQVA